MCIFLSFVSFISDSFNPYPLFDCAAAPLSTTDANISLPLFVPPSPSRIVPCTSPVQYDIVPYPATFILGERRRVLSRVWWLRTSNLVPSSPSLCDAPWSLAILTPLSSCSRCPSRGPKRSLLPFPTRKLYSIHETKLWASSTAR
ncbi:hypothetical protein MSAN_00640400 [Mycena sanguinolenta]|uniref:Uncharacterized protein n=1 Tax=Mycena sanguinolenta TaxID=230812 RepID=A0A8H7DC71_9AGAR|nr:hypothetical protein MSAN_00640400 [Mycena sanguinolenta]